MHTIEVELENFFTEDSPAIAEAILHPSFNAQRLAGQKAHDCAAMAESVSLVITASYCRQNNSRKDQDSSGSMERVESWSA